MIKILEYISNASFILAIIFLLLSIIFFFKDRMLNIFLEVTKIKQKREIRQREKKIKQEQLERDKEEEFKEEKKKEDEKDIWNSIENNDTIKLPKFTITKRVKFIHSEIDILNDYTEERR